MEDQQRLIRYHHGKIKNSNLKLLRQNLMCFLYFIVTLIFVPEIRATEKDVTTEQRQALSEDLRSLHKNTYHHTKNGDSVKNIDCDKGRGYDPFRKRKYHFYVLHDVSNAALYDFFGGSGAQSSSSSSSPLLGGTKEPPTVTLAPAPVQVVTSPVPVPVISVTQIPMLTALPTTRSPALGSVLPTTLSPAVATALPTTLSPALATAIPTTLSPALATVIPTTLSPALATAIPTTLSPALATAIPATLPPVASLTTQVPTVAQRKSAQESVAERSPLVGWIPNLLSRISRFFQ